MHFTIIGAGAVGGTIGAYLARAGYQVLMVDKVEEHVRKINQNGLTITGQESFTVDNIKATLPKNLNSALNDESLQAVLVCVKAMDTAKAVKPIVPFLSDTSYVVSMQNGLNEYIISHFVGWERTVGGFVNFSADYHVPGEVIYGGEGAMFIGELNGTESARVTYLGEVLKNNFLSNTTITQNIWGFLWGKLAYASMLFASALVDETIAEVLEQQELRPLLVNLAAEIIKVADSEGVQCESFDGFNPQVLRFSDDRDWEAINASLDDLTEFNKQSLQEKSGIWRDLAVRKRRTEVDDQIGSVICVGDEHGLKMPLNQRLVEMIHEMEKGKRDMKQANLDELVALNQQIYK